ncbi:hypothetical protein HYDPIDRAFT_32206 [Hydnomerulius pinastri MD-312]|uniref:Uncharacterized protein n=1 Tax=Hydnomerulius pinastri MD-312 TaxID=994086 RepID=A0A0C9V4W1_9AGAM|nr:hypothetical protein HYDPIDRAFT_32206 [Hydnomerulius pinastri MD-312]
MGITVKQAVLVSIIIESILYGLLMFLFGVAVWALTYQRTSAEIARLMLGAACLLFILGTMHIVVDANHLWQGFIASADPDMFFEDITKNTFKNALYLVETLVGDGIIIYRGYLLWRRIELAIIPIIGWMAIIVTGIHTVWSISQLSTTNANSVFLQQTGQWVVSFFSTALATNLVATGLLIFKLWAAHRNQTGLQVTRNGKSLVQPVLVIVMECGAVYSLSLVAMLSTYLSASNSVYIVIDLIGQIIPITFCVIIVRAAMLRFERERGRELPLSTLISTRSYQVTTSRTTRVHVSRVGAVDGSFHDSSEFSHPEEALDRSIADQKSELHIIGGAACV